MKNQYSKKSLTRYVGDTLPETGTGVVRDINKAQVLVYWERNCGV